MGNTSATGGYIVERPGVSTFDQLENVVHDMLCGLTELDKKLVRPAWQENPLADPDLNVDWCSFYIRDTDPTNGPETRHISDGNGNDIVVDQLDKEILASFFGPNAEKYAGMTRRGLNIEQNRWPLRQAGVAVRAVGNAIQAPTLTNQKWLRRVDLVIAITYEARGEYDVLNLIRAVGTIYTDQIRGGEQLTDNFDTDNK